MNNTPISPVLILHGGAGTHSQEVTNAALHTAYEHALKTICAQGYELLLKGASALEVVTEVVVMLEDCELFNAGKGAVLTSRGEHELDAAVMEGHTLKVGAIAGVKHLKNPIRAARRLLDAEQVLLIGAEADEWGKRQGLLYVDNHYFTTALRQAELKQVQEHHAEGSAVLSARNKMGTVGAVALDLSGHLASATSTGGLTNKLPGRVGDSPIIGAGTYANDKVAVSCTGTGEAFIRSVVSHEIAALVQYAAMPLVEAANTVIHQQLKRVNGEGGLIAIDHLGNIAMPFNTEGMYRAYQCQPNQTVAAIY